MQGKRTVWIHASSYTFRLDKPDRVLETIWCERPGWGFMRRRDIWTVRQCMIQDLIRDGYVLRKPISAESEDSAITCSTCGMYITGIPGNLVRKHIAECSGRGEDWKRLEETVIDAVRLKSYQSKILAERLRIQREQEEAEIRERFDRIKEENLARQRQKDRKARLRRDAREELLSR
jgi:hypothetical protein